jgi:Family of unknown function (DUF6510)
LKAVDEGELRLDGNALAGRLREIFAREMTSAMMSCAVCGHVGAVGAAHLYMGENAPGAVLRCEGCEAVLMVLVERDQRWRLGTPGLRWLDIA